MTICNVRDFGAAGNRQALDTAAIQAAIDAAGRCNGQVRMPAGEYLSGSLMLRSGVSLHLEAGASLVASRDMRHFARSGAGQLRASHRLAVRVHPRDRRR